MCGLSNRNVADGVSCRSNLEQDNVEGRCVEREREECDGMAIMADGTGTGTRSYNAGLASGGMSWWRYPKAQGQPARAGAASCIRSGQRQTL